MGKVKLIIDNVEYQNIKIPGKILEATIAREPYVDTVGNTITSQTITDKMVVPTPFINAVDIDWGQVTYNDHVINSTTDFVKTTIDTAIETQNNTMAISGITAKVDEIDEAITTFVNADEVQNLINIAKSDGLQGPTGVAGQPGAQGLTGVAGQPGAQGVTGVAGQPGIQGRTGIQGITGARGIQGLTGVAGQLGAQGLTGVAGQPGTQGPTGVAGQPGAQGATGAVGQLDASILNSYATKDELNTAIANLINGAPDALDTLNEIAEVLAGKSDEENPVVGLIETVGKKADISAVSALANIVGDNLPNTYNSITEAITDLDARIANIQLTPGENGATGIQGVTGAQGPQGEQGIQGETGIQGVTGAQGPQGEQGIQGEIGTFDASALEAYATTEYVDSQIAAIVGGEDVSANFDTLKEVADALADLKVVDVEAVEPVEGVKFTQEEIDAAQEGDEAYGKTTDDWKVEPVEGVEEQSHNMTIAEFVTSSMEAVDEKEEIAKVQAKYNALLTLLNLRETDVNNVMINEELANSSTVTFDEPVDNIIIPETTAAYTVTAPLDDNATVTLTSNKYMTLDNTSEEPVSATVQRPAEVGETGTSGTTVYLVGQYDTLTLENVSPNVKSGRDAAQVNNVVISENNTKNLTLNLDLQDGATITNNSATAVTINDKNDAEHVLAIVAPNSTVTLNGGTYTTLNAEVSDNTLVIKRNAHIGTLNVTKGNVKVEVARQSDIANVIDNLNIAEGYTVDYLHDDITSANISKLTTTGTHVFQEDLTKSGNFSVGLFSSDDMVWDLNGHNLTSSNTRGYGIFTLRGTAQLEINDTVGTGVVKNTADEYGFWTSTVGSKVVINGGNFEAATHVLYAQKGTIEVNGGTFKLTDAATADKDQNGNFKFLLNCHDEDYVSGDAQIIVRGGKFYGFDPSNTYGEPGGPVSYVANGYESVPTNEAYEYGTVYEVRHVVD